MIFAKQYLSAIELGRGTSYYLNMSNTEERKMIGPERASWMKGQYVRKSDGNDYRRLKAEAEGSFTYVDISLGIVEVGK